jgi:hypothetical protein
VVLKHLVDYERGMIKMIFKVTKPVHYFLIITLTLALLLLLVANLSSLVFADNANNLWEPGKRYPLVFYPVHIQAPSPPG